jgi:hypothetical protein
MANDHDDLLMEADDDLPPLMNDEGILENVAKSTKPTSSNKEAEFKLVTSKKANRKRTRQNEAMDTASVAPPSTRASKKAKLDVCFYIIGISILP